MENFFLQLIMISLYASILILIIMILRQIFRKIPKNLFLLLWIIVVIRLLCPISFDNIFSLIPEPEQTIQTVINATSTLNTQGTDLNSYENEYVSSTSANETSDESNSENTNVFQNLWEYFSSDLSIMKISAYIWIVGIIIGIIYSTIIYARLKSRLNFAVKTNDYYLYDGLGEPCVVGLFRPRIYIPNNIDKSYLPYIMAHEHSHIKRKDNYIKLLWYITCLIYWFNPLIWIAFYCMSSDIEQACDETTVKNFDINEKMMYANTILTCSIHNGKKSGIILGLGNGSLKSRIKNLKNKTILKKKYIAACIVGCIIIAVIFGFGYQPVKNEESTDSDSSSESSDTSLSDTDDSSDKYSFDYDYIKLSFSSADFSTEENTGTINISYEDKDIATINEANRYSEEPDAEYLVSLFGGTHAFADTIYDTVETDTSMYIPVYVSYELSAAQEIEGETVSDSEMHYYFYSNNSEYFFDLLFTSDNVSDEVINEVLNSIILE